MTRKDAALNLKVSSLPQLLYEIKEGLKNFFNFESCDLYFPGEHENREPTLLAAEKSILLPVIQGDSFLGMLKLGGADIKIAKKLWPHMRSVMACVLQRAAFADAINRDPLSGLFTEGYFFEHIESQVQEIRSSLGDPSQSGQNNLPLYKMCVGLIIISWLDASNVAHIYDYDFKNGIFQAMSAELHKILPENCMGAILGKYENRHEFGVIFTSPGKHACHKLAKNIISGLENLSFIDNLSGKKYSPALCAGYVLYPQDMRGHEPLLPMFDQILLLCSRARLAARTASETSFNFGPEKILAFSSLLKRGGKITKCLGKGTYQINLGISANVREGMRFQVLGWKENCWYSRGQVVIVTTEADHATAETLFLEDVAAFPEIGDRLALVSPATETQRDGTFSLGGQDDFMDMEQSEISGVSEQISSYSQFFKFFNALSQKCDKFVLAITRYPQPAIPDNEHIINGHDNENAASISGGNHFFSRLLENMGQIEHVAFPDLTGAYGKNGLVMFFGNRHAQDCQEFFNKLHESALQWDASLTSGLFNWPFLDFNKNDSETCALKALELAMLLPEPHIGVFNSMALTIAGDKKFSQGDTFGSIQDYKMALLADGANAIARNSLGVCYAAIGKMEKARESFTEALENAADPQLQAKICYNLGTTYQRSHDLKNAEEYYNRCLAYDFAHVFAWFRLGQINLEQGSTDIARAFFEKAARLAKNDVEMLNLVERNLAILSQRSEHAKALLHDNMLRNPSDAASLLMLAKLYMEEGANARIAEMLARESVNLYNSADAWDVLGAALEADGKSTEAEKARIRARILRDAHG